MAELIAAAGPGLEIWRVHPDEVREQDINARVMPPEMLERLARTIKTENRLESLPFAVRRGDSFELISGHHRLRAARMAELAEIYILADTRDLDRSKVVAKQIAHNRIAGQDDPETLKMMFDELQRVDDILESFLDAEELSGIDKVDIDRLPPLTAAVPWTIVQLAFLPGAVEDWAELERRVTKLPRETDLVGVVDVALFERFAEAVERVGKAYKVRAVGAVIARMVELALEHTPPVGADVDEAA